ncbi:MAG: NAD(P)H-dependent glycerol-3-phosphate dehydrogenase [Coprobacillus sp.]|nr:NAD(P)H-dependent glycerol-3-phosphate dehydrogenase [Coprobacillus sp.]
MKFGVIGGGAWGTTLAQVLDDNGYEVIIYSNREIDVYSINNEHRNITYFPDNYLSEHIKATTSLEEAVKDKDVLILSVPTVAFKSVLEQIEPLLTKKVLLINTAKGFDVDTNDRLSETIRKIIPETKREEIVSLIGPSHAEEVIIRDLTCICAVSKNKTIAKKVAKIFSNSYFRVYTNDDEVGSELCAAMKNAIAIGSGVLEGLGYGDNARAALCTRGLAEITKFVLASGGKKETLLGLTGLGDLVVTCYSRHSRNFCAGEEIGKDDDATHFLETNTKTVEGLKTIEVVKRLSDKMNIELPIIDALYQIIYSKARPSQLISSLMNRPLKSE